MRRVEQDIQSVDFQIDLLSFDVNPRESRAEKVLWINNLKLEKYYDLNISQNNWVFSLGIFCILLGVFIISGTLYLILQVAESVDSKIITAATGAFGSLLSSYIATIYLKLNASASSHLVNFHSRLVETHQLLLGNLLASRIENDEKRWEALSKIADNMSKIEKNK